jgi:hypothetical protein
MVYSSRDAWLQQQAMERQAASGPSDEPINMYDAVAEAM